MTPSSGQSFARVAQRTQGDAQVCYPLTRKDIVKDTHDQQSGENHRALCVAGNMELPCPLWASVQCDKNRFCATW